MDTELSYLTSRGEFVTLKNAIASWFHQDAFLDFDTNQEIWSDIWSGHDSDGQTRLMDQLSELLARTDNEALQLWNSEAGSHNFTDGNEAKGFLASMREFFKGCHNAA